MRLNGGAVTLGIYSNADSGATQSPLHWKRWTVCPHCPINSSSCTPATQEVSHKVCGKAAAGGAGRWVLAASATCTPLRLKPREAVRLTRAQPLPVRTHRRVEETTGCGGATGLLGGGVLRSQHRRLWGEGAQGQALCHTDQVSQCRWWLSQRLVHFLRTRVRRPQTQKFGKRLSWRRNVSVTDSGPHEAARHRRSRGRGKRFLGFTDGENRLLDMVTVHWATWSRRFGDGNEGQWYR